MAFKLITNPLTGEAHTATEWARILGYTKAGMKHRLNNMPIEQALNPNNRPNIRWEPVEDELLIQFHDLPNLQEKWSEYAKAQKINSRTLCSIQSRIKILKKQGKIPYDFVPKDGTFTSRTLAFGMGVAVSTVIDWVKNKGLPARKSGNKIRSPYFISIQDFIAWATDSNTGFAIAKSFVNNPAGVAWFIQKIKENQCVVNSAVEEELRGLIAELKEENSRLKSELKKRDLEEISIDNPEKLLAAIASICPNSVSEREAYRIAIAQGRDACIKYLKAIRDRRTA